MNCRYVNQECYFCDPVDYKYRCPTCKMEIEELYPKCPECDEVMVRSWWKGYCCPSSNHEGLFLSKKDLDELPEKWWNGIKVYEKIKRLIK